MKQLALYKKILSKSFNIYTNNLCIFAGFPFIYGLIIAISFFFIENEISFTKILLIQTSPIFKVLFYIVTCMITKNVYYSPSNKSNLSYTLTTSFKTFIETKFLFYLSVFAVILKIPNINFLLYTLMYIPIIVSNTVHNNSPIKISVYYLKHYFRTILFMILIIFSYQLITYTCLTYIYNLLDRYYTLKYLKLFYYPALLALYNFSTVINEVTFIKINEHYKSISIE